MGLWPSLLRRLTPPPILNSRNILLPKLICMLKCVLNVTLCAVKPSNYFFQKKFLWNIYKVLLYQVTLKQFSQNFFSPPTLVSLLTCTLMLTSLKIFIRLMQHNIVLTVQFSLFLFPVKVTDLWAVKYCKYIPCNLLRFRVILFDFF